MRFTHVCRAALSVCLLVLLTASVTCTLTQPKDDSRSSSSAKEGASRGLSAFAPSNDPRKDLRDALERLNQAYPYRLTETSSGTADGREIPEGTRVVEFAAADRSHAKWNNGPLGDTEVITIGDKQYTKLNNGNWNEGVRSSAGRAQDTAKRMRELLASVIKDVKYAGTETVNGVACHAYAYAIDGDLSGQKWLGTGKAWVGASDGLPHQLDSELNVSASRQKSHITYEYDLDFKIEKPQM
jgi:hypothetical protein